jgi:hypothetical protein
VPLGLEEEPSTAEQSQTATANGASSIKKKENLKKRSFFINSTRLFYRYSPHGNKCAGVGCNFKNSSWGNKAKLTDIKCSEILNKRSKTQTIEVL